MIVNNKIAETINKLKKISNSQDEKKINILIAKTLMQRWNKFEELSKIVIFTRDLNISVSSLSKFLKQYDFENFHVIRYFFKLNKDHGNETSRSSTEDNLITEAAQLISKSKRVIILGTGNSALIGQYFYTKLVLAGYHAVFLSGTDDQLKLVKESSDNDCFVGISHSLTNKVVIESLESNKKNLIFTAQIKKSKYKNSIFMTVPIVNIFNTGPNGIDMSHYSKRIDQIISRL